MQSNEMKTFQGIPAKIEPSGTDQLLKNIPSFSNNETEIPVLMLPGTQMLASYWLAV